MKNLLFVPLFLRVIWTEHTAVHVLVSRTFRESVMKTFQLPLQPTVTRHKSERKRNARKSVTFTVRPADVPMAAKMHSELEVFRMFFNNLAAARHMIGRPLSPWRHCRCIIFLTCAETMEPGLVSITKLDLRRLMRPQSCVWMCVVSPRGDTDPAEILLRWPTKAKFLQEMSFWNFCTDTKKDRQEQKPH